MRYTCCATGCDAGATHVTHKGYLLCEAHAATVTRDRYTPSLPKRILFECADCPVVARSVAEARSHAKTAGPVTRPDGRTVTHRLDRVTVTA